MRGLEKNILFVRGVEGCRVHRRTRFETSAFPDTTISGSLNVSLSAETIFVSFALTLGSMILGYLKTRRHMPVISYDI